MRKKLSHSSLAHYLESGASHNGCGVAMSSDVSVSDSIFDGFKETVRSTNTAMEVVIMHPEFEKEIDIE